LGCGSGVEGGEGGFNGVAGVIDMDGTVCWSLRWRSGFGSFGTMWDETDLERGSFGSGEGISVPGRGNECDRFRGWDSGGGSAVGLREGERPRCGL
jgi:hypothetical protein